MARLMGIDVGTSGAKVVLVDETGSVLRQASRTYPLLTPKPLWSEQNPSDWWDAVCGCIEEIGVRRPDAVGLTGQMHGAVFLDDADQVIRPAILWNDQRTKDDCARIDEIAGPERVRAITRNPPLTGFQAPKILWLRRAEPESYSRVRRVLLPKDYIRLKLSGVPATDVSDASGTGLFDVPRRQWSEELLGALEIPPSWLPEVSESFAVDAHAAGGPLEPGVPIVAGAGDQAAGAVGAGAVSPGIVSVSLGTSGVVFTPLTDASYDPAGAVHTFCHANGAWHAMSVMLSCGGSVHWFRDSLAPGLSFDALAAEAEASESAGVVFLPYLAGERSPHNDPNLRAAFLGLTLAHHRGAMSRAVFEGATFGLRDGWDALRRLGSRAEEVLVIGGGAQNRFWVQLLADVFETRCVTLEADEGPAFGAALLAGVGVGVWNSVAEACRDAVRRASVIEPTGRDYSERLTAFRESLPKARSASDRVERASPGT